MTTPAATFRAKTTFMKSWRPRNPPSNRDRLELYALHRQSVSGDAPDQDQHDASVADKAKLSAWRGKHGMSQADAMSRYIEECDRQLRVYGIHDGNAGCSPPPAAGTSGARTGEASASTTPSQNPMTPLNTPSVEGSEDGGVLLCPRGLAAIPLLCAAAAESRSAYLARLQVTHPSGGWWAKQEPLCLEVNSVLSIPEKLIIAIAAWVEHLSLVVGEYAGEGRAVAALSPGVLRAFLWPTHNAFLCCWISLILVTTYLESLVVLCQTLLFGAKRTGRSLGRLFVEEIRPSARAAESLCEEHQAIGVRLSGLALMPLTMSCDLAASVAGRAGMLLGSFAFVGVGVCGCWYWMCVLPWLASCGLCLAVMSGWCFGLIELAGN